MELDVRDVIGSISEGTRIVHRPTGGPAHEVLLTIGDIDLYHEDETRYRVMGKLIDQWVESEWSEDIETLYLAARVKRGLLPTVASEALREGNFGGEVA